MKTAVCISGQPRFLQEGYSTIYHNLIRELDADVFIHSWYNNVDKLILDLYKPTSYSIELPKDISNSQSMFYSIYEANRLKKEYEEKNNFVYDCVIRCRFDLFILSPFEEVDLNFLNLYYRNNVIHDLFAVSNSAIMDIYSSVHLENYKIDKNEDILRYHLEKNEIPMKDLAYPVGLIRKNNSNLPSPRYFFTQEGFHFMEV